MKRKICAIFMSLVLLLLLTGCEGEEVESSVLSEVSVVEESSSPEESILSESSAPDLYFEPVTLSSEVSLSEAELKYVNKYTVDNRYRVGMGDNFIARNDEWIFYIHDNGSIMRMREDGSDPTPIIEEMQCFSLFLLGDVLYFASAEDRSIYASNFDGSDIVELISEDIEWFTVTDKYIFYIDWASVLHRTNLDGTGEINITENDAANVRISGDKIVYEVPSEETVYCASLDGENPQVVFSSEYIPQSYVVYRDHLYYVEISNKSDYDDSSPTGPLTAITGRTIYSIDLNTMENTVVTTATPECSPELAFWGEYLIYSDAGVVFIHSLETGNFAEILGSDPYNPVVLGDCLYYRGAYESGVDIDCVHLDRLEWGIGVEEPAFDKLIYTDEYLFFRNRQDLNIYRTEIDGSDLVKLSDDECESLYHYNDKLFYMRYAPGYDREFTDGFFELSKSGEGSTLINEEAEPPEAFYENYAYYSCHNGSLNELWRFNLNEPEDYIEDEPFLISENEDVDFREVLTVTEDWLYVSYSTDTIEFVRMRWDGSGKETLLPIWVDNVKYHDGKIYYSGYYNAYHYGEEKNVNNRQLWRMNPDGTENEMLLQLDSVIEKYEIADGAVYYLDSEYDYIYKFDLSSREKTQLTDVPCTDFTVSNGGIYFSNAYDRGAIYLMSKNGELPHKIVDPDDQWRDLSGY